MRKGLITGLKAVVLVTLFVLSIPCWVTMPGLIIFVGLAMGDAGLTIIGCVSTAALFCLLIAGEINGT